MSGIVFIDSRVADLDRLIAGLAADMQVFVLDPAQDGIAQIAAALEGVTDLASLHIISHGSSGALYLGASVLTESNLEAYKSELSQIGASLADGGDLLLYGCDVGAGTDGQSFIEKLALYTDADVAASTDRTGSSELGGDWKLEAATGAIETDVVVSSTTQETYSFTLSSLLLIGTPGDDSILGGTEGDEIRGLEGNDWLDGKGGDDILDGGPGHDTLIGGTGNDTVHGGDGNDEFAAEGSYGDDHLFGDAGSDYFYDSIGNDVLDGGEGADFFRVYYGYAVTATGGAGQDTYRVDPVPAPAGGDGQAADYDYRVTDFASGPGGDLIEVVDLLQASALLGYTGGNPFAQGFLRLVLSGADTRLQWDRDGDAGSAFASWETVLTLQNLDFTTSPLTADNFVGRIPPDGSSVPGETINGTSGDDVLSGGIYDDQINGLEGNDTLSGGGGNDLVDGGAGNDVIAGGLGADTVSGGAGSDIFSFAAPPMASSSLLVTDFAPGADLLDVYPLLVMSALQGYDGGNPFAQGFLQLAQSGADTLLGWDRDGAGSAYASSTVLTLKSVASTSITASDFVGRIPPDGSTPQALAIDGTSGADTLVGGLSGDQVNGLEGNDWLFGEWGDDHLDGGGGNDYLVGGAGNDVVSGGDGDDGFTFGYRPDGFADELSTAGDDTLLGGPGNDTFLDFYGSNLFDGGSGDDHFLLSANAAGSAIGGIGRDTYRLDPAVFDRNFVATDFAAGIGGDLLDVDHLLSASTGYTGGNPFASTLGYLRLLQSGADTLLQWNGDGAAGQRDVWLTQITLQGIDKSAITSDNFVGRLIVGTPGHDLLIGGLGNDTIQGLEGDDVLDGSAGADLLEGGPGSDTYYVDDLRDVVEETSDNAADRIAAISDGELRRVADTVVAAIDYSLQNVANVENLTLSGDPAANVTETLPSTGIGNELDNVLTGNALDNVLIALTGNDSLVGGPGADSLYGGTGDDAYYVDGQADLVFENAGEGADTVISSASFYLYAGIEKLILASGAGDIFGSANELDNTLTGNEGVNLLLGWDGGDTVSGGGGNDVVYGVNGADSLVGDAGIDVLVAGEGNDTLDGGADPDLLFGENGNDLLYGGTGFFTDILVGGAGEDVLDGSASSVSGQPRNEGDYDLMYGGTDNDTYQVDTPFDLTFETEIDGGGGTDTVIADITGAGYYLYAAVENLVLQGNTPFGVGNDLDNVLTGSALANWLLGGAGNDTLNGKASGDVLFGETGADTFVFERGTGGDVIGDFTPGTDKLQLAGIGYTNVAEVKAHMVEAGGVSAIDLGAGDFVVLHNVTIASLSDGDFVFG